MFPLPDQTLKLGEIATHWSSELEGRLPTEQVLDRLVGAFWAGELICSLPGAAAEDDLRARLLRIFSKDQTHPGILFLKTDAPKPPAMTQISDGEYEIDARVHIIMPEQEDARAMTAAYMALKSVTLDSFSHAAAPALQMMSVTQSHFESYCLDQGFDLPAFWFAKRKSAHTAAALSRCRRWFLEMVSRSPRPPRKQDVVGQMKTKFDVSERAALDVWDKHAPASWKAPGPKSPRRR
jgi:hypothetical protein